MVGALVVLALTAVNPPPAYLDTGSARVPLAIVSWCWEKHCGAPFTASAKAAVIRRNATARIELAFTPKTVHLTVGGRSTKVTTSGHEVSWAATRGGGVSFRATAPTGWVNYVTRIRLS